MNFAEPLALLALLALIPILGAWTYASWRRRRIDALAGGPPSLRRGRSGRRGVIRATLLLGAVALVAVAIARPQWGGRESPLTRRGIDVALALDISRSMTATDIQPSRAEAAAAGLSEMLAHLRGDRVGLVTFSGSAFERSPLTLDLNAITFLVNRAQVEQALVEPGTDIAAALDASLRLLDVSDRAQTQAIVVVSDGEDLGRDLDAAIANAKDRGVRIYTIAVGTDEGAPVPARSTPGAQPAAPAGESGFSRADRATLGRIASETGGETRDAQGIAGLAVEFTRLQQTDFAKESSKIPVERFQWFLGGAVALLLVQWLIAEGSQPVAALRVSRTRLAGAGALLGIMLVGALLAGCGGSVAYRKVQEGNDAYAAGRYEEALSAYQGAKELLSGDPVVDYNIGNTLNRLGRFDEAMTASRAAAQDADREGDAGTYVAAMYAAGNHAFQNQALEEARDAYIAALLRDPNDADAKHNLEVVLRLIGPTEGQSPQPTPTPPPTTGQPGDSPTPAGGEAGQADGSPTPASGQGGTPQAGGTPAAAATPAAGSGTPSAQPDQGQPGDESLSDLLDQLLADGVTPEEALQILDRLRADSEAAGLEPRAPGGAGGMADR